jgi:hypothetical protein
MSRLVQADMLRQQQELVDTTLLYANLLRKLLNDRAMAERLIAYEAQRDPGRCRREWIEAAIIHWEHDNR